MNKDICCKLKIDQNTNPISNQPFSPKEQNIKMNMVKECNKKISNIISPPVKSPILKNAIPIGHRINLNSKNENVKKSMSQSAAIDLTNEKKRSPISKKKKTIKSPKKTNLKKKKDIQNYTYIELKKIYKSKIDKKLDTDLFLKFKKKYKIKSSKYISNLTKDEFIKLIEFLKL